MVLAFMKICTSKLIYWNQNIDLHNNMLSVTWMCFTRLLLYRQKKNKWFTSETLASDV